MNYTENLTLKKPAYGDNADVADLNYNADILDSYVYNNRQMQAPEYNTQSTYNTGDIVTHNGALYICLADNVTGAWDSTKWSATTLAEQIELAKQSGGESTLADLEDVNLTNPSNGQLLQYNGSEWVNGDVTVTKTASGNPVEFTDGADAPLVKCTTAIQGYQEGTGTPSPSNVRPIHAYNQSTISVGGKNLLDESTVVDGQYLNDSGVPTYVANGAYYAQYIPVTSGTYTISFTKANDNLNFYVRIHGYNSSKVWQSLVYKTSSTIVAGGFYSYSFTVPAGISFVRFSFGDDISNVQIEKGTTATDYEPYVGTTHTATFSNSIYQGNADFIGSGATCNMPCIDLGDLTWTKDGNNFRAPVTGIKRPAIAGIPGNGVCSHYPIGPQSVPTANTISFLGWMDGIIFWGDGTYETVEAFTAAMVGVKLAYELATPTTETITPTNLPIKSLFGYNHIESSTGDVEVEYITENYQPLVDLIQSSNGHTYSTQEQVVGTWIDGQTLYEKTYTNIAGTGSGTPSITVDADIKSNSGNYNVKEIKGLWSIGDFGYTVATTQAFGEIGIMDQASMTVYGRVTPDGLVVVPSNANYGFHAIMTIRYTKTTQSRSLSKSAEPEEPTVDKVDKVDKVDELKEEPVVEEEKEPEVKEEQEESKK